MFSEIIYKDPKCKCTKFQVIRTNKFIFRRPNIGVNQVPMTSIFFSILPIFKLSLYFGLKNMCRKFQVDHLSLKRVIVPPKLP